MKNRIHLPGSLDSRRVFLIVAMVSAALINASCMAGKSGMLKQADQQAEMDQVKRVVPETVFDENLTKLAMERGRSSIRGVLFHIDKYGSGRPVPVKEVDVILYPMTPYMEEVIELEKQVMGNRGKQKLELVMDKRASKYAIVSKTDQYGRFQFANIKPGKYFMASNGSFSKSYNVNLPVGFTATGTNGAGQVAGYTHYQTESRTNTKPIFYRESVQLNADGQNLEIEARMRNF